MFSSRKRPSVRLSAARSRSPCSTTMSTADWLSSAVEKVSVRRAGIVVFRSITLVLTPPRVSTPSDSGVTSRSTTSSTSPFSTPAWSAAPMATTSSGFTVMFGSLPPVSRRPSSSTAGPRPRRDPRGPADEDPLVDGVRCELGVGERLLHGAARALDQVLRELLELGAGQRHVQVLGAGGIRGHERQVDLRRGRRRELDLRPLRRLVQALERLRVRAEVDSLVALELVRDPVDHALVEVVAAEVAVAARGAHLHHAVANVQQGDVERAAAEVEHEHRLLALLVEAVGQRRSRRLVDDPEHLETRDLA